MNPLDAFEVELRGTTLIEASAGTGKTFTITTLYLRLVLEEALEVADILVITYTRAATAELRERVRRRLVEAQRAFERGEAPDDPVLEGFLSRFDTEARRALARRRIATALANFDEAAILTIHGFCQRALREHAFESRSAFDVELLVDQGALLREIAADLWSRVASREEAITIEFMHKKHTRFEQWLGVARNGAEALPPRVIPEEDVYTRDALLERERAWRDALEAVRGIWASEADVILELLRKANEEKHLKGTLYSAKRIASTWKRDADALFGEMRLPLASDDDLSKLSRYGATRIEQNKTKNGTPPHHPFFDACDELLEANGELQKALHDRQISIERELIHQTTALLEARKREAAHQSYDDLLAQMKRALDGPTGKRFASQLRSGFRAALVDEFQDTDQLQYEVVRAIWHDARSVLFLIGDPKQAIYAFRGADVHAYLRAKQDAGERCLTLNVNWRSDPGLIDAVESLFVRTEHAFRIDEIDFESVSARPGATDALSSKQSTAALELLFVERDGPKPPDKEWVNEHIPRRVAADIAKLLASDTRIDDRPVTPHDVAVLCRTNEQTVAVVEALRAAGVTAALLGTASVFDSDEARELERVLEAVADPRSLGRIRAALATRLFGIDAVTFDTWSEDDETWDDWLDKFTGWHDTWSRHGFIRMFHALLREEDVHRRMLGSAEGERRLANFLHLSELAERAAQGEHLGPAGMVQWLSRVRADRDLRGNEVGEEGELRLESDREAVRVVTIHKSKGLEYPIVYCPFLFGSAELGSSAKARVRFHAAGGSRKGEVQLDLGSPEHEENVAIAQEENLAEDMRMLYVALTRARHRCSVVWGAMNNAQHSALFTLLHPKLEVEKSLKDVEDETLRAELETFVSGAKGSCAMRDLVDEAAPRLEAPPVVVDAVVPEVSRVLDARFRHSSFSQLAASERDAAPVLPPLRAEGADRDEVASESPVDAEEREVVTEAEIEEERPFASLAPGAKTGVLLHSLLEHLDFLQPVAAQFADPLANLLDTHGVPPAERDALARDFERVLAAPIDEDGLSLGALARSARLDEVEFLVPVGGRGNTTDVDGLRAEDLAAVFRAHADDPVSRRLAEEYAPRLERLRFDALEGFLRGFVDLVFEWRGCFYVVDYKSNQLGSEAAAYTSDALLTPMLEHHYVLQYHLYTVAIDRYLAQRVVGYDYETHFGGVYYLFLRGMGDSSSLPTGIYAHRPSRACIADLSALFDLVREVAA